MGWIALVIGAALWFWSLALSAAAYRGERMPMWSAHRRAPRRAVLLRAAGAALVVLGIALAAPTLASSAATAALLAGATVAVVLLAPAVVVIAVHNGRITD